MVIFFHFQVARNFGFANVNTNRGKNDKFVLVGGIYLYHVVFFRVTAILNYAHSNIT